MPIASLERNPSSVSLSGVSVGIDPYATDTQSDNYQELGEGTHNIPAGKYTVVVKNDGVDPITANGITISPEGEWVFQSHKNPATQKLDLTPAITIIVPVGGAASYYYSTPSA